MTKELLQQALNEAKADAIHVFTYAEGISAASKDAIEYMHSWLTVYFEKQALAQQEPIEQPLERDGILEWTPSIGIECAILSLRDDAARLRDGGYTPLQIADDLDVIANELANCKPDAQQEQPNPWSEAVIDQLVVHFIYVKEHDTDPRKAVKDLLGISNSIALDPQVSSDAQALIDRGRREAQQEQPAQEPVAWLHGTTFQVVVSKNRPNSLAAWLPLFAHPAPTQPAQGPCGCREGECETKKDKSCRMTLEIAERDGIPEWTQEQPASVDAYVGAREDAAIWKKRALEAEELNRKFIAEVNGPTYLGEPVKQEQPTQEPVAYGRDDEMKAITALEKNAWISAGRARVVEAYTIPLYTHPAPTQPALSDDEILNCFYASKSEGMVSYMLAVGRAIEAHCRGGQA